MKDGTRLRMRKCLRWCSPDVLRVLERLTGSTAWVLWGVEEFRALLSDELSNRENP
jgi:hypothetical protein